MQITRRQLEIYRRYAGDEDGLARAGTAQERAMFGPTDWQRITALIQALALANSQFASDDYKASVFASVRRECNDADTEHMLRALAH
jgi:hypothetical protein